MLCPMGRRDHKKNFKLQILTSILHWLYIADDVGYSPTIPGAESELWSQAQNLRFWCEKPRVELAFCFVSLLKLFLQLSCSCQGKFGIVDLVNATDVFMYQSHLLFFSDAWGFFVFFSEAAIIHYSESTWRLCCTFGGLQSILKHSDGLQSILKHSEQVGGWGEVCNVLATLGYPARAIRLP